MDNKKNNRKARKFVSLVPYAGNGKTMTGGMPNGVGDSTNAIHRKK